MPIRKIADPNENEMGLIADSPLVVVVVDDADAGDAATGGIVVFVEESKYVERDMFNLRYGEQSLGQSLEFGFER